MGKDKKKRKEKRLKATEESPIYKNISGILGCQVCFNHPILTDSCEWCE